MNNRFENKPLPQTEDGRTYISDQMIAEDSGIKAFLERTINSWAHDPIKRIWVLHPSIHDMNGTRE